MSADRIICTDCMRWHLPPACGHDCSAPCLTCGRARGYRWTNNAGQAGGYGSRCWRCQDVTA